MGLFDIIHHQGIEYQTKDLGGFGCFWIKEGRLLIGSENGRDTCFHGDIHIYRSDGPLDERTLRFTEGTLVREIPTVDIPS